jgi:putative SOS response-associated peptidase YedK
MCGRFYLKLMADEIAAALGASIAPDVQWDRPRYNIAPTQDILIVRAMREGGGRELATARWGLVPRWADDPSIGNRLINARSESVATAPAFRDAFARRRCLVPASGFFEWQGGADPRGPKRPFRIERADGGLLTMAGLWESWKSSKPNAQSSNPSRDAGVTDEWPDAAGALRTVTILTTDANPRLAAIHHRTPVFLEGPARDLWLDPDATPEALLALLRPAPEDLLQPTEISRRINKPENDDPNVLDPAPPGPSDPGLLF